MLVMRFFRNTNSYPVSDTKKGKLLRHWSWEKKKIFFWHFVNQKTGNSAKSKVLLLAKKEAKENPDLFAMSGCTYDWNNRGEEAVELYVRKKADKGIAAARIFVRSMKSKALMLVTKLNCRKKIALCALGMGSSVNTRATEIIMYDTKKPVWGVPVTFPTVAMLPMSTVQAQAEIKFEI